MHKLDISSYLPFFVTKEHRCRSNSVLLGITSGTDFALNDFLGRTRGFGLNVSALNSFAMVNFAHAVCLMCNLIFALYQHCYNYECNCLWFVWYCDDWL